MTEIESGIPVPIDKPKARARKQAAKKEQAPTAGTAIIAALEFAAKVQEKESDIAYETHCIINNGWIVATNGQQTIGGRCPQVEKLSCCPRTLQLLQGLKSCGDHIAIKRLENSLHVVSGKFSLMVPCIRFEAIPIANVDSSQIDVNDKLLEGIELCSRMFCNEDEQAAMFFTSHSVLAMWKKSAFLEHYHGLQLPISSPLIVPRAAVDVLLRCKKRIKTLGVSDRSVTFYFEDETFLQTLLYDPSAYWSLDQLYALFQSNKPEQLLPQDFFEVLEKVSAFSKGEFVYFQEGTMTSERHKEHGCSYEMSCAFDRVAYNYGMLIKFKGLARSIIETNYGFCFVNGIVRGAIAKGTFGD